MSFVLGSNSLNLIKENIIGKTKYKISTLYILQYQNMNIFT